MDSLSGLRLLLLAGSDIERRIAGKMCESAVRPAVSRNKNSKEISKNTDQQTGA
jgi:hypothetical protein